MKEMTAEKKMPYIYNHIELLEENIQAIKENIKWITSDIKVIKKFSKTEN